MSCSADGPAMSVQGSCHSGLDEQLVPQDCCRAVHPALQDAERNGYSE
jgi:hypothetical protein